MHEADLKAPSIYIKIGSTTYSYDHFYVLPTTCERELKHRIGFDEMNR